MKSFLFLERGQKVLIEFLKLYTKGVIFGGGFHLDFGGL